MAIGGIRTGMSFSEEPRSATMQGGAGAAENATVAENFSLLRDAAPKYGRMEQNRIAAESAKRRAVAESNASVRANSMSNMGAIESSRIQAKAQADAAEKKAQGSTFGSIVKAGIPLLASAIISDKKAKNNIEHIQDALATLRELRPVTFYYNEEYSSTPERLHHGFIAQEYAKHMPDATYYDESIDSMCIDTIELIALLVRSVQQLETKVTRMEAQHALAGVKS
ncbi:MAG: hypothetical protein CMJ25_00025 [Phycisphaerae bacterium]|nr:hypothetical protein [Phycisphaerae bacterium]|tara:strand:+ start:7157 stop:7831 length:675 start_codon:yes stop_codon:yes gene_type:complete